MPSHVSRDSRTSSGSMSACPRCLSDSPAGWFPAPLRAAAKQNSLPKRSHRPRRGTDVESLRGISSWVVLLAANEAQLLKLAFLVGLFLLHAEFLNTQRHVVQRLFDHCAQF